jgi:hypothetical protein
MHTIVLALVLALAALGAVLLPRPILRTAGLAWFAGILFLGLQVVPPAAGLAALAVLLVIVDLLFYREPAPEPDIGDRVSASATIDDDDLAPETQVHVRLGDGWPPSRGR